MNLHFYHPLKDTNVALGSFQFWQEHAIHTELVALIKIPTKMILYAHERMSRFDGTFTPNLNW